MLTKWQMEASIYTFDKDNHIFLKSKLRVDYINGTFNIVNY